MDAAAVSSMLTELFATIQLLSGYPVPERHPPVTVLPAAELQEMICKRPCAVKAFYLPDKGVFVSRDSNIQDDIQARSVLLHELVHHLQHLSGKFESLDTPCRRWQAREVEAYEIQHKYLRRLGATRSFIGLDTVPITCPEDRKDEAPRN